MDYGSDWVYLTFIARSVMPTASSILPLRMARSLVTPCPVTTCHTPFLTVGMT
jgi:hypothetical protein